MLQLIFAVAFSAVPLTLYIPPIRSLNLFVETIEDAVRQTMNFTVSVYPRVRFAWSRFFNTLLFFSSVKPVPVLQPSMEDLSEQQKALAWIWVVEGLASMKQVDVSLLKDLLGEIGTALPDHMSKSARERVALRCLEELFGSCNNGLITGHVASSQNGKISFDLSESCQSVLKRITDETPESDLREAGPGLLRWDVGPFIVHKKATMPKCALKQLKESILDGSHPHADVLREKSGLTFTSDADRVILNESTQSQNKSSSSTPNMGVEGKSENENLLLSKRDRIGSDDEKRERANDSEDSHIETKKMNLDASHVSQSLEVEQNRIPSLGKECLQDTSERRVPVSVNGRCDGAQKQMAMEKNRVKDGHSDYAASKTRGKTSDDAIKENQTEIHSNSTSFPQDTFQDKGHQHSCHGEAKDDGGLHCKLRVLNVAPLDDIRVPLLSSTDEPQQIRNADEGNGRGPEYMAGENLKSVNHSDDYQKRVESKEWDAYSVLHSVEQKQLPLISEDSSEREVPVSESLLCDLTENQMEMMEEVRVSKEGHDVYKESKRNGRSSYDASHQSQLENCCNATPMPKDIIQDEACQRTCVDKTKGDGGIQHELRASGVGAAEGSQHTVASNVSSEHDFHIKAACPASIDGSQQKSVADKSKLLKDFLCESETSAGSDGFHDRKIDAAMKKHALLRSQCTSSHGSLETTVREKKCSLDYNKGGQLLTCKMSNCPVVVHENWLRSSAISFDKDNFYCPFCSYSLALADYREAKNKKSLLETGLSAFIHATLVDQPMEPVGRVHSKVKNCTRQFEGNLPGKPCQNRHLEDREVNQGNQCEKQEEKVVEGDHLCSKNTQSILVDQGKAGAATEQEVTQQHSTDDSLRERSKYSGARTQLVTTQSRRERVPWTVDEEEILKKGVQELQCNDETRIPWKQILEFGYAVFSSTRTTTDLEDKWRNISKGSPKSK